MSSPILDFGEFHAMIAGVLVRLWLFVLRLSCSGRAFPVAFATQAQEAFLEGHVLAFEYFGAVPTFNAHMPETGTRSYRLATSKTSSRKRASQL